jgi:hypothetical protein
MAVTAPRQDSRVQRGALQPSEGHLARQAQEEPKKYIVSLFLALPVLTGESMLHNINI